ncbi:hypothetical protein [Gemmata sp.]|uniref:hypothetical protein n=1 Tax=Gemmata sp. TaxID=1914242 RepID=UPI003F711B2F
MSQLSRGQAALVARLRAAGKTAGALTYVRASAAGETVDLTGKAWVGRTMYRVSDATQQSRVIWSDRDYLIPAADLALAGVPFEPARGDYFVEVLPAPGGTQRFEVLPFNDEPEFRYSDPQRTTLRVHTKRVTHAG